MGGAGPGAAARLNGVGAGAARSDMTGSLPRETPGRPQAPLPSPWRLHPGHSFTPGVQEEGTRDGMTSMNRRALLRSSGAALLAGAGRGAFAQAPGAGQHVAVIGGGIIGASIAYHLAASGAQVTVLEKSRPAAGATRNSFAWLNAGGKRPRPYFDLNLLGVLGWHRLQSELGAAALPMQWGGCVDWAGEGEEAARTREKVARQQQWGYPIRMIGARDIAALLPGVTPGPVGAVSFCPLEGTVNPVVATQTLLAAAQGLGAKVEYPATVTGFDAANGRVGRVLTKDGALAVDGVAIAAGLECQPLAAMLGAKVPVESSIGVLAHSDARPVALPRLAYGPGANIKQNPDGGFVTGASFAGTPDAEGTRAEGEALLAFAARYVPAMRAARLADVTLGHRVLPKDSFPIVGALPGVANAYVAAMHSGMTMAPLIGQLAAAEILGGPPADLLATFRPDRFV
jgi:glycine/D-amino acid oxidase-like deaminating enzyme